MSVKIIWQGETIPYKVQVGFLGRFNTKPYTPEPNQCYRCLKYGHIVRVCTAQSPRCRLRGRCTCPNPLEIWNIMLRMFNKSYSLGRLPAAWKHALLGPIPKPCNNGYRPITLLSCISKIMEILILNRLNYCARPLSKHSMDFKKGSDTVDAVATLVNYLTSRRDKGSTAIFIDLEKPVEPSDPLIMLTSLINAGIERNIIKWIQDYLRLERGGRQGICLYCACFLIARPILSIYRHAIHKIKAEYIFGCLYRQCSLFC